MKKNTIKAFTLVEMLIVIVIIGILIAALLPRMQAAQWRARDVARKTALSQIQSAIVTYQGDNGKWPWSWDLSGNPTSAISLDAIKDKLINAWMTDVPTDPLNNNVSGLAGTTSTGWNYLYLVSKRNWADKAWFILMAQTEVAWGSNWVVCSGAANSVGQIAAAADLTSIQPCSSLEKKSPCSNNSGSCTYENESQLRYIVLY